MRVTLLCSSDVRWGLRLAGAWADAGDSVTVVLLDAASALVRTAHAEAPLVGTAAARGVTMLVHDDALRRRGVVPGEVETAKPVTLDEIADLVVDGTDKVIWT